MQWRLICYLTVVTLAAIATGIQLVMIPWLATGVLQLDPAQVGWVQASLLMPGALLLLMAGSIADRSTAKRYLSYFYLIPCGFHCGLLWVLDLGYLSLSLLMLYAAGLGASFALVQPLRDRLLPNILIDTSPPGMQKGVVLVSMYTYLGQAIGVWLAGRVDLVHLTLPITVQAVALLTVAVLVLMIVRTLPNGENTVSDDAPSIGRGLRYALSHPVLSVLLALVAFNGFMNLGAYLVVLPILVRDVYQQGADFFSWLQLWFVFGTLVATLLLLRTKAVNNAGRSLLFCLLYSSMIMLAIASGPNTRGLSFLLFSWGLITGVSSSMGKTLLQQVVDERFRGRALSLYFLALLGAAPLGALAAGYLLDIFGAPRVLSMIGGASLLVFCCSLLSAGLWGRFNSHQA